MAPGADARDLRHPRVEVVIGASQAARGYTTAGAVTGTLDSSATNSFPITITPPAGQALVAAGVGIPSSFSQPDMFGDPSYTQGLVTEKATRPRVCLQYREMTGGAAETADTTCAGGTLNYIGVIMAFAAGGGGGDDATCVPAPGQPFGVPPFTVSPTPTFGVAGTTFTSPYPFADGSLRVFLDEMDQTPGIVDYDGSAGTFTLAFDVLVGEQLRIEAVGR